MCIFLFQNLTEMKKAMFEVLLAIRRLFSAKSPLLRTVLKLFTDALIAVLNHDVKQVIDCFSYYPSF